jgi:hypothetical protein
MPKVSLACKVFDWHLSSHISKSKCYLYCVRIYTVDEVQGCHKGMVGLKASAEVYRYGTRANVEKHKIMTVISAPFVAMQTSSPYFDFLCP